MMIFSGKWIVRWTSNIDRIWAYPKKKFFFDQLRWDKISGRLRHIPHVFVLGLSPYNRMSSLSELPTYPMFLKQKKKVVE